MKRYTPIIILLAAVFISSGCAAYQTPPAYGHEPARRVVVNTPEYLYIIPSFGVYFVPNLGAEVFFVDGRWYYSVQSAWYWAHTYRGPWTYIQVRHIPSHLRKLPRDYRVRYRHEYYRVPYGHWEKRHKALPPKAKHKPPTHVQKYRRNVYLHPQNPDIVFHDGYWYRKYKGIWYQGRSSTGPWRYKDVGFLPKTVRKLPPEYRERRPEKPYKPVPWEKVQKKYRKKIEKRDREWGFQY